MKILLVQPEYNDKYIRGLQIICSTPPLALELIAGSVPGDEVLIVDVNRCSDFQEVLANFQPEMLGVTAITYEFLNALDILKKAKEINREIFTVIGGTHATLVPRDCDKEFVDAAVIGEGEVTFPELVDAIKNRKNLAQVKGIAYHHNGSFVINPARELTLDMDALPFPRRDLTEKYKDRYHLLWVPGVSCISTSRGCLFRCKFCSVWKMNPGKPRDMRPARIIKELEQVTSEAVFFVDDSFLQNPEKVRSLLKMIKERDIRKKFCINARADHIIAHSDLVEFMAELGLILACVGLESYEESNLEYLNKRTSRQQNIEAVNILNQNGIISYGCVIAHPNFAREDFATLVNFVKECNITLPQITILTPSPGTEFYSQVYHQLTIHDYNKYDFLHLVMPSYLEEEEFYRHLAQAYKEIITPKLLTQHFLRMHGIGSGTHAKGGMSGIISQLLSRLDFSPGKLKDCLKEEVSHFEYFSRLLTIGRQLTDYRQYIQ